MFRASLEQSIVPKDWKTAIITPVFKGGDPQSVSQYRPISLTSILCKVLERVVRDHPNVEIKLNLATNLFNMKGSQIHLRKAIMNLVNNAAEA